MSRLLRVSALLLGSLMSCHGARMMASSMMSSTCPGQVQINTKGDCMDNNGKIVASNCCDCKSELEQALHYYQDRLDTYMSQCNVEKSDIKQVGKDFVMMDDSRVCSDTCQNVEKLQVIGKTLKDWATVGLCSGEPSYKPFEQMQGLVLSLDTAHQNCEALFEPVTPNQKKTVFLIDVSNTMSKTWSMCKRYQGCERISRLEAVKRELAQTIDGLDEEHEFALVSFSTFVRFASQRWMKATPANKQVAKQWLSNLKLRGPTKLLKALKTVHIQKFPDYSAITYLGDGESTDCEGDDCLKYCYGSVCKDPKPIHTTLLMPGENRAASQAARTQLKNIAAKTGGKFREPFRRR